MEIESQNIKTCADALVDGKCIAYPTEAVWGLGCDPDNEVAVNEILRLKQRPVEKGLILVAADIEHFSFLLRDLPPITLDKMRARWPGHVTWLVPHHQRVRSFICGESDKVAIRVSAHPLVQALGRAYGQALVSTSANPAGLDPALTQDQVRDYFGENSALVYASGEVGLEQRPSTIIDAETGVVIRS